MVYCGMQARTHISKRSEARVSDAIILVGSVPCQVSNNNYVTGRVGMQVVNTPGRTQNSHALLEDHLVSGKRRRLVTTTG
jgi:hypothetical protein